MIFGTSVDKFNFNTLLSFDVVNNSLYIIKSGFFISVLFLSVFAYTFSIGKHVLYLPSFLLTNFAKLVILPNESAINTFILLNSSFGFFINFFSLSVNGIRFLSL